MGRSTLSLRGTETPNVAADASLTNVNLTKVSLSQSIAGEKEHAIYLAIGIHVRNQFDTWTRRMKRAGTPAYISWSPMDFVRTAFAPTTLPRPTTSWPQEPRTFAPVEIVAPSPMMTPPKLSEPP